MSVLYSMTGYGRSEADSEIGTFDVEAKSVNHRFLDVRVLVPREMGWLEPPLAQRVKRRLSRGKVDVTVRWTPAPDYSPRVVYSAERALRCEEQVAEVGRALGRGEGRVPLEFILSLPGVGESQMPPLDEAAAAELADRAVGQALDALCAERAREGKALETEIAQRLGNLRSLRDEIESRGDEVVEAYRRRLQSKAQEWARRAEVDLEPGRLEAEVLVYADRADVAEELVRLAAHIEAFEGLLKDPGDEPAGKRMDFLAQELLRETNTIASKSRDTQIGAAVLSMKNEIETIREQILNVE